MTQIAVMLFLMIVGIDPNSGAPVMVQSAPPSQVTLEECMSTARTVNSDPSTTQIVVCLPLLEKATS